MSQIRRGCVSAELEVIPQAALEAAWDQDSPDDALPVMRHERRCGPPASAVAVASHRMRTLGPGQTWVLTRGTAQRW